MSSFKSKALASTSNVASYNKEELGNIIVNFQNERVQMIKTYEGFVTIYKEFVVEKRTFEIVKDRLIYKKNAFVIKCNELKS